MKHFSGEEIVYCYDDELNVEVVCCCGNCEFCIPRKNLDGSSDFVCCGSSYGEVIEDLNNWYCNDFGVSLAAYLEEVKRK